MVVVDTEKGLKEKLNTLKKNLDAVGREVLKARHATAYKNLVQDINTLSNELIHEKVTYLDLALVKEESLPGFCMIFDKKYAELTKHLLDGDYSGYMDTLNSLSSEYASHWCDNVVRSHVEGQPILLNPFEIKAKATVQQKGV